MRNALKRFWIRLTGGDSSVPLSPFWEGERAQRLSENPYKPGTPEHSEWLAGWQQGLISKNAW